MKYRLETRREFRLGRIDHPALADFARDFHLDLVCEERGAKPASERYSAQLRREGFPLYSVYGLGPTPDVAIADHLRQISGKQVRMGAYGALVTCPQLIDTEEVRP